MEQTNIEPQPPALATRHDGWTGEAMAIFLETLAETGVVVEACDAARKSHTAAYALRRRNHLFAEAWEAALGIARDRLADTLLARSLEGNVEQFYKDGELVGEKHSLDNRLGLAILKRLDQRTDPPRPGRHPRDQASVTRLPRSNPDWELALTALRTGQADDVAAALAMLKGSELAEVAEVANPRFEATSCPRCAAELEPADPDPPIHCWRSDDEWWTGFPPPEGFTGVEVGDWGQRDYQRHCTDEELALLEADHLLGCKERLAAAASERDRWFAELKEEVEADGGAALVEQVKAALSQLDD